MEEARELFKKAKIKWDKYQDENPDIEIEEVNDYINTIKGWDSIGFHRVLGGIFYDYGLSIIEMFMGFLLLPFMIFVAMPYPSSAGYYNITAGFFSSQFTIFDFGTL
ncbi:MAG: hypothetical protein ACTSUE_04730 [Promethearchaeota archaeon]